MVNGYVIIVKNPLEEEVRGILREVETEERRNLKKRSSDDS